MDSNLILSREGIFPLADGQTGLGRSGTIQGEGKLAGMPSMFVRLQGCNLRCIWTSGNGDVCLCDTAHSSFGPGNPQTMSVRKVFDILNANMQNIRHVVLTGGEPMLQAKPLAQLMGMCRNAGWHTTLETNGTLFSDDVVKHTSLLSISPKLTSTIPTDDKMAQASITPDAAARRHADSIASTAPLMQCIEAARRYGNDIQLKFVVSAMNDEEDIKRHYNDALQTLAPEDILVMPMGFTQAEIAQSNKAALQMCVSNGWRYTPRLHIDIFGNKEGV